MRSLTTDWNNVAYASATEFTDKNGAVVTIPANKPQDVRSMYDSVSGGDYVVGALDTFAANVASITAAVLDTDTIVVTASDGASPLAGIIVDASSSNVALATVSPASGRTNGSGQVTFTTTAVAAGSPTITVKTRNGAFSDTVPMTIS